jgi:hypothetical protein
MAAAVIEDATGISRFPRRDHFAARNGTAPAGVSSGNRTVRRLSLRGNRRVNHAVRMAAITRIRRRHGDGRACHDRKTSQGKTRKKAPRALKRRISDAICARPRADAAAGPGGQAGNDPEPSAASSHPGSQLFGQATPEPAPTPRPAGPASPRRPRPAAPKNVPEPLDSKEVSICLAR